MAYNDLNWASPSRIKDNLNETFGQIRKYNKKIKKPFKENGEPLEDSTIKTYQSEIKSLEKNRERLRNAMDDINSNLQMSGYHSINHPFFLELIFRYSKNNESWSTLWALSEAKKVIKNKDDFREEDVVNMVTMLWGYSCRDPELSSQVWQNFISNLRLNFLMLLDHLIQQNDCKVQPEKKTSAKNVISLFSR